MAATDRISRFRRQLMDIGVEALIFFDMKNIRYLSGFSGSEGMLIVGQDKAILLVDGRYITQAGKETTGITLFEYRDKNDGIEAVLADENLKTVGFESQALDVDTFLLLQDRLKGVTLKPVAGEIRLLRSCKDESEIVFIQRASSLASDALMSILGLIKPGVRERDLALELDFQIRRRGAAQMAFDTIVASGSNAVRPHARPTDRMIEKGDIVVIDYGAVVEGYHSDETCTFVVGKADEQQEKTYRVVKDAHDRALDMVMPGVLCREVDRTARDWIAEQGMGSFFPHATGHGLGLDIHETPRLSPKSDDVLQAGMVVTVEPGIYIPDRWGIRIEDLVVVQEGGCRILSKFPKAFTVLG